MELVFCGKAGNQEVHCNSGECHLQVFDVIQSPKLLVKFGDAMTDFFHLEDGDRCLSLIPLPQCKREPGRWPGSWGAKRQGQLTSELF